MGRMQRVKGARFEVRIGHELATIWPGAKRGIGQARSAKEVPDVTGTPFWVETKRHRKVSIQAAYRQGKEATDGRDVLVVSQDDHGPTLVTMDMETFKRWISPPKNSPSQPTSA